MEIKAVAAERSRMYRERHRQGINERRREIRRQQNLHQIHTVSINEQNTDNIEQNSHEKSTIKLNSHTKRQRRYYERHRDEINQRKRDQRLKQTILQSVPATAAERNRKYRERKRQEINERRRKRRQCKKKLQTERNINQEIYAKHNINDMDCIEKITEATHTIQDTKSSTECH